MGKIKLGDAVAHKFTGFAGIAVSRHSYVSGCDRIGIQPKIKEDGTLPESKSFDEPEVAVVKKNKIANVNKKIGGVEKYSDSGKVSGGLRGTKF